MFKLAPAALAALILSASALASPAEAQVTPFPPDFKVQDVATNGVKIHVRVGGKGPAVVLLHGYGETGDMWEPMAVELAKTTPSSCRISGVWACRPSRSPAATTRRTRARMWLAFLTP